MIRLYQGSGSGDIELVGSPTPREEWADLCHNVCRLLRARGKEQAADLLESIPFDLYEGQNPFGDEFSLLYFAASLEQYVELAAKNEDPTAKSAFRSIAETISEVGPYIRFVAVALDTKSTPQAVSSPPLAITSDAVERALADCEQLVHSRGAASGVDRIHTALHGYLRAVCVKAGIPVSNGAGITDLFKAMRVGHPKFAADGPRASDIDRIVRSMANIVDSLNPLRNQATLAHPNEVILEDAEAMLVINSVRTLLHYVNAKLE
ncbi:MAG: abortive infection family protein [Dehalococcoidia bacterium]|nr:abortive infection family protein [Dehalococcoidia bacterium]